MLCRNPYMMGSVPFGCGQCQPCRINRRRLWTARMVLESFVHPHNLFVTLTYNEENHVSSLVPDHLTKFFKRLRHHVHFRYFAVGEYGDQTQRPHYHFAFFCDVPVFQQTFEEAWGKGFVHLGELNPKSAAYIAAYVNKKMTSKDDPRLNGRHPEFARMSRRPGLGNFSANQMADVLRRMAHGDVPLTFHMGGQNWPLGRYIRNILIKNLELNRENISANYMAEKSAEVLALWQALDRSSPDSPLTFKDMMLQQGAQGALNQSTKLKIYESKQGVKL